MMVYSTISRLLHGLEKDKATGCWLWTRGKRNGYGRMRVGRLMTTHRLAYELLVGPIPHGMDVLHNCPGGDNPACCNPFHLWLGNNLDNVADMIAKGRHHNCKGEKNFNVKLTAEKVESIRLEYSAGGTSMKALGKKYGVDKKQICNIVNNKHWSVSP